MSVLRGIFGWMLAVGVLSAKLAGASILLAPVRIDGPVVPPIHVPSMPGDDLAMGEKI